MSDTQDILKRVQRFLDYQQEVYGPFSLNEAAKKVTTEKPAEMRATPQNQEATVKETAGTESFQDRLQACTTLNELRSLCESAEELKTDLENTRLVFGVGNPNADLMLIGEAPGEQEDKEGEPFVGRAGQLLNKILSAINFKREDVYTANILKHRPPNNRNPLPEEQQRSMPYLERQIDLVQPKLILCLGKISANALLQNNEALGKIRGSFHTYRGKYELLATYHPAALLRNPNWKRGTWEDVQLLRKRYDELSCKP